MNEGLIPIVVLTAIIFTVIGFVVGYILGRRSKNTIVFALKFTTLQIVGVLLFVIYNRYLDEDPSDLVNLGLLSLIGGEAVGMLFTSALEKSLKKAVDGKTNKSQ